MTAHPKSADGLLPFCEGAAPRIVSISRRTDIPAFHTPWLLRRLEEGCADWRNPFNPQAPIQRVSLSPRDVAAVVLWSKNYGPLLPFLDRVTSLQRPVLAHVTVNDYPPFLEGDLPPLADRLATTRELARRLPPGAVVWRYDPLIFDEIILTTDWHLDRFSALAASLEGTADRVMVSVVTRYRKTVRNLAAAARTGASHPTTLPTTEVADLLWKMYAVGARHGISLAVCCAPDLTAAGLPAGACIDRQRLWMLGMDRTFRPRLTASRPGCRCAAVVDIGAYDTCRGGCIYCYATDDPRGRAKDCEAVSDVDASELRLRRTR